NRIKRLYKEAIESKNLTNPIVELFRYLLKSKCPPAKFGIPKEELQALALKHMRIDEHRVSVGGRVLRALNIVEEANKRVKDYLESKDKEVKSGIELWDKILENQARIKRILNISDSEWDSYDGQIRNAIDSVEKLAKILDLNEKMIRDISRVTKHYRMRISPYYASLMMPGEINDPILLQSVPTGEMIDNAGIEIEPVAADHSPARLIDQFYPRVLSVKVTNMCAMYCTHCLRIAHIGTKDRIYSNNTYNEALDYIRKNKNIRDVLITGGDALVLSNAKLKFLLDELDKIEHVKVKRVGTRIPITSPQRIDDELLEILEKSNDKKPIRIVTQINTAREITPVTRETFKKLNRVTSAILNQAVLLRGINDTKAKMWKLCEVVHENYVRPYYLFNCSYRNPQFAHLRVPIEIGQEIVEGMYGNISGDAIPRYIATAGGKIPLHRSNIKEKRDNEYILVKPWSGEEVSYPDMSMQEYKKPFSFERYL
ncbi:MAG: KamA family radical SAM protein, partial [Epsilonproteobacteria bacterium]|nr:KamA family radical SAM protein [Campylobacterota bacterium]